MTSTLASLAFASFLLVSASDQVPTLDTGPTCAGVSRLWADASSSSCRQDEKEARDALSSQWKNFSAADRRECVAATQVGGYPSYVQVLTCLEMARDARAMPAE
jgi:LAS superfamily LD-carboxypeptidase LdcB